MSDGRPASSNRPAASVRVPRVPCEVVVERDHGLGPPPNFSAITTASTTGVPDASSDVAVQHATRRDLDVAEIELTARRHRDVRTTLRSKLGPTIATESVRGHSRVFVNRPSLDRTGSLDGHDRTRRSSVATATPK